VGGASVPDPGAGLGGEQGRLHLPADVRREGIRGAAHPRAGGLHGVHQGRQGLANGRRQVRAGLRPGRRVRGAGLRGGGRRAGGQRGPRGLRGKGEMPPARALVRDGRWGGQREAGAGREPRRGPAAEAKALARRFLCFSGGRHRGLHPPAEQARPSWAVEQVRRYGQVFAGESPFLQDPVDQGPVLRGGFRGRTGPGSKDRQEQQGSEQHPGSRGWTGRHGRNPASEEDRQALWPGKQEG